MNALSKVVSENEDLFAPYFEAVGDTRSELRRALAGTGADLDHREARDVLLSRPVFVEYGRLVERFPLLRSRMFTAVLLNRLVRADVDADAPALGFVEIAPLADAIQKFERTAAAERGGASTSERRVALAAAVFDGLLHVTAMLARSRRDGGAADAAERLRWLVPLLDRASMIVIHEARQFGEDLNGLVRWFDVVGETIARWVRAGEPAKAIEMVAVHLLEACAYVLRFRPDVLDIVLEDARLIAEKHAWFAAGRYLYAVPPALRTGNWNAFRSITLCLARRGGAACAYWLWRAPNLLRRRFPLALLERHLVSEDSGQPPLNEDALLQLPLHGAPPEPAAVHRWWTGGGRLGRVHKLAASQYLRIVPRIEARFGAGAAERWAAWGEEIARASQPEVAVLFFDASSQFLALRELPEEPWFHGLRDGCAADSTHIESMRSDLWMLAGARVHLGLQPQWSEARARVAARFPAGPNVSEYVLTGLPARSIQAHIDLWRLLGEHGRQSFIKEARSVEVAVACLAGGETLRAAFCLALATRMAGAEVATPGENEVAARLDDPEIAAELKAAAEDHRAVRMPKTRTDLELIGSRARPGDVLSVLRQLPPGPNAKWFTRSFGRAIRRRRHYPALHALFAEADALPDYAHSYREARLIVSPPGSLLDVLAGASTGSCTDGPRGTLRHLGLVHALHRDAFKIVLCVPRPSRGWELPLPVGTLPGFRASLPDGRAALLVDSMELGGEVNRFRDSLEVLARHLALLLRDIARDHGLCMIAISSAGNTGGRLLYSAYRRAVPCREAEIDLVLDARDLHTLGVRSFYSATLHEWHPPGLRRTGHAHLVPGVRVLVQGGIE